MYIDIKDQKLPNYLTFPAMFMGLVCHLLNGGLKGLFFSMTGLLLGLAFLFLLYIIGGTGAGDVKLMGAVGAFLGPKGVFIAFIATSIVGGVYAIALLAFHGYLQEALKRYWGIFKTFIFTKKVIYIPPSKREQKPKLCYGVAIALGTIISMLWGIYR